MTVIELKYDAFKAETILLINDAPSTLRCFGTGENVLLSTYIDYFFPELVKKISLGPGAECGVKFYGTFDNYEDIINAHKKYCEENKEITIKKPEYIPYPLKDNSELLEKIEVLKNEKEKLQAEIKRMIADEQKRIAEEEAEAKRQAEEKARLEEEERLRIGKIQRNDIIRAYHEDYEKLLKEIESKNNEYPFVKSALTEIFENYFGLFKQNIGSFYKQFIFDFPLVILGTLANNELRPLLVSAENITSRSKDFVFAENMENIFLDITRSERYRSSFLERYRSAIPQPHLRKCSTKGELNEIKEKYTKLYIFEKTPSGANIKNVETKNIISKFPFSYIALDSSYPPYISSYISSFSGNTEGYWKDIKPNGKNFMVISMEKGNFIRNGGKNGEKLKAEDVNGKFPILDGIDYKSNNAKHKLFYMEV